MLTLAHVSMMKYHILYFTPTPESSKLYMITLSIKFFQWCSRSDWPPYEVAASESGSYLIMASIFFWLLQWECYIMALCMTVITWSTFGKHENSSLLKNFVSTSWKSILKLGNLRIFSHTSQTISQQPPKVRSICMRQTTFATQSRLHCFPNKSL